MKEARFLAGALLFVTLALSCFALDTSEKNALTALKNAYAVLSGPDMAVPWTGSVSSACDNNWSGIACYEDHVIYIGLNSLGLTGTFPASIVTGLTYLESIDLQKNSFTGTLPSDWSPLQALGSLNLWSNKLSGTFPASIWALPNIASVDVYDNAFTGSISSTIGSATELTYVGLDSNKFSGTIPSTIGGLTELAELWLCNNSLSGTIPNIWSGMSSLQYLRLDRNNLAACAVTALPSGVSTSTCNISVQASASCGSGCDAVWTTCTHDTIPASCSPQAPVQAPIQPPTQPPTSPPVQPPVSPPPVAVPAPVAAPPPTGPPPTSPVPTSSPPTEAPPVDSPVFVPVPEESPVAPVTAPVSPPAPAFTTSPVAQPVGPTPSAVIVPSNGDQRQTTFSCIVALVCLTTLVVVL